MVLYIIMTLILNEHHVHWYLVSELSVGTFTKTTIKIEVPPSYPLYHVHPFSAI